LKSTFLSLLLQILTQTRWRIIPSKMKFNPKVKKKIIIINKVLEAGNILAKICPNIKAVLVGIFATMLW
jgi:hypothetical protein